MQKMIIYVHCKREVPANPRLKGNQRYCNLPACQNARQKEWYQNKIESDPDYAARQSECKRNWRENKPVHAYQTRYRLDHPEYVKKNREKQRARNRKRRLLEKQNELKKIVKIDTFIVELQKCQEVGFPSS